LLRAGTVPVIGRGFDSRRLHRFCQSRPFLHLMMLMKDVRAFVERHLST